MLRGIADVSGDVPCRLGLKKRPTWGSSILLNAGRGMLYRIRLCFWTAIEAEIMICPRWDVGLMF